MTPSFPRCAPAPNELAAVSTTSTSRSAARSSSATTWSEWPPAATLGAMGSARTNFYNDAYRRAGFVEAAREVQALWLARKRDEAAARVPDEMVLGNTLIGDEARIRDRIRAYRDAGVTRLSPAGATVPERLDTLGRVLELIRQEAP
ncbi:MAG: LLM class flavin-dependent oxidoreductase [Acidobacteria bacterium]|nr:LLM class flavin-dependent oxidoreductase [Acidobacteriota bacterium]